MSSKKRKDLDSSKKEQSITSKKQNVASEIPPPTLISPPSTPKKGTNALKKTPKNKDPIADEARLEKQISKTPSKRDAKTTTPRYKIGYIAKVKDDEMFSHLDFKNHVLVAEKKPRETFGHLTSTDGITDFQPTVPFPHVPAKDRKARASKETDDDAKEDQVDDWDDVDNDEDPNSDNGSDASPYVDRAGTSDNEGASDDDDKPPKREKEKEASPAFVFRFAYIKKPDGTEGYAKIPRVMAYESQWSNARDSKCDSFAYEFFTYHDLDSPQDDSAKQFVYTGPRGNHYSPHVLHDVFIPVEELKKRLCGSKKERLDAYTQDWEAFQKKASGDGESGSHLQVCTVHGQRREQEGQGDLLSFAFLQQLFDKSTSDDTQDIPAFIFQRWCAVAFVAAKEPKKAFNVNSRFWSHEYMKDTRYALSPPSSMPLGSYDSWSKAMEAALNIRNASHKSWPIIHDESKVLRQDTTDNAPGQQKGKTLSTAGNQAKGPTNAVPSKAGSSKGTPTTKAGESSKEDTAPIPTQTQRQDGKETVCFILDRKFDNYLHWGTHPQGFYVIWIHENSRTKVYPTNEPIKQKPPSPQFSAKKPGVISGNATEKDLNETGYQITNEFCKTKTILKCRKLRMAEVSKRVGSQNQLMGNLSANEVARRLDWDFTRDLAAEWLHKSAYSFGSVGDPKDERSRRATRSQQDARNLVFGTIESNTAMIIYESYLKRLTRYLGRPVYMTTRDKRGVDVTTSTDPPNNEVVLETRTTPLGKNNYWLSESLTYTWSFTLDKVKQTKEHKFPLFSMKCPTMFEAELHEAFDELWMGSEKDGKDTVKQSEHWKPIHDWLAMQGVVKAQMS